MSTLRRGGNVSVVEARLAQDSAIVARASATLGSARAVAPVTMRPATPIQWPWFDVPPIPVEPPLGPVFGQKYEYRSTGPLPFSGAPEALAEGWIRERRAPAALDEAAIAGLLDAWWPTVFAVQTAPRASVTVGYTMQLLVDPRSLTPVEPLFYRARGVANADNYFVEMRELWSADRLVAMNQQTFALLT